MKQKYLEYTSDWEYDKYSFKGQPLFNIFKVEVNGIEYRVKKVSVSVPYNDMGHTYVSTSDHFFIMNVPVLGILMDFDLRDLMNRIKVIPLEYEVFKV